MQKACITFILAVIKLSVCQISSTSPTYSALTEFQSGSAQFFNTLKTSSDPIPTYTFTFNSPFAIGPRVVYGIQKYASKLHFT